MKTTETKMFWVGMLGMVLVFGMTLVGCGGDDDDPTTQMSPENKPYKERWFSWIDSSSTATLNYTVGDDDVVTVTVGGTAEIEWDAWKATVQYEYTAKAGKNYKYTFEAWTETGTRQLHIQYFWEEKGADLSFSNSPQITSTRTTYTLRSESPIPKNGVAKLSFRCANQIGKLYIKLISITEENETWSDVTTFSQVHGTWKAPSTATGIIRGMNFNASYTNYTVTFDVTEKTMSLSGSMMSTFSGGNIDTEWPNLKENMEYLNEMEGATVTIDNINHSFTTIFDNYLQTWDDELLSEMGYQINQNGTKLKMEDEGGNEVIYTRQ